MQKVINIVRVSLLYSAALLIAGGYPLTAMADTVETPPAATSTTTTETPQPTQTTTPPPTEPVTTPPSVAPAPVAPTPPAPKPKETYTYNSATGHWDSNKWQYNATSGKYERPPQPAPMTQPTPVNSTSNTPVVVSPGTGSTNKAADQQDSTIAITDTTKNALANALNSAALSGDATVKNNTYAGSAMTGDATAATTILNNINSTVNNDNNQKAASFVSDVMGDVHGDIVLQPMLLKAMLEAGAANATNSTTTVKNTNQLTNDINLNATSGNAGVTGNTTAGDATTGSAHTVANVMNIVNSMVSANRSFVGTVNIYGNLDGDILVAPDFIPQLLASNTSAQASDQASASTTVNSKDTQSIVNNVALAANSGSAAVLNNTTAGNATTGDANTNVVIFNLSGHQIVASNSLLVFVNVLGKWVGVIVDAPTGATAAAIGSGVTQNTSVAPDLVISTQNDTQITNNINLNSQSGNAIVANNTTAGNATSGAATASANIGNIVGSQLGLSDWFGVLFINVFGTWHGSFGVDTAYGNPVARGGGSTSESAGLGRSATKPMKVIEFIPRNVSADLSSQASPPVTIISSNNDGTPPLVTESQPRAKLASAVGAVIDDKAIPLMKSTISPADLRLPILTGSAFLTALSFAGLKRLLFAQKPDAMA